MPAPGPTNAAIADALRKTKGMVYVAADLIGCSPNTIKSRLNKSAALRQTLADAKGMTTDTTELKLFQGIQNGEPWAIQFYLRTQARDRGYGQGIEIRGSEEAPITIRTVTAIVTAQTADEDDVEALREGGM